jgi:hypothetical protein
MTHFKKFKPFMTYVSEDEHIRMKKFAKLKKITMAQMIREAIDSRLSVGDPYTAGYNAGIDRSIAVVNQNNAAKMRFPSGKSFAELIVEELAVERRLEVPSET